MRLSLRSIPFVLADSDVGTGIDQDRCHVERFPHQRCDSLLKSNLRGPFHESLTKDPIVLNHAERHAFVLAQVLLFW